MVVLGKRLFTNKENNNIGLGRKIIDRKKRVTFSGRDIQNFAKYPLVVDLKFNKDRKILIGYRIKKRQKYMHEYQLRLLYQLNPNEPIDSTFNQIIFKMISLNLIQKYGLLVEFNHFLTSNTKICNKIYNKTKSSPFSSQDMKNIAVCALKYNWKLINSHEYNISVKKEYKDLLKKIPNNIKQYVVKIQDTYCLKV